MGWCRVGRKDSTWVSLNKGLQWRRVRDGSYLCKSL